MLDLIARGTLSSQVIIQEIQSPGKQEVVVQASLSGSKRTATYEEIVTAPNKKYEIVKQDTEMGEASRVWPHIPK